MSTPTDYLAIFIQFLVAMGFVVTTMVVSHWAGPKRKTADKLAVFECGIECAHAFFNPIFSYSYPIRIVRCGGCIHVSLGCKF